MAILHHYGPSTTGSDTAGSDSSGYYQGLNANDYFTTTIATTTTGSTYTGSSQGLYYDWYTQTIEPQIKWTATGGAKLPQKEEPKKELPQQEEPKEIIRKPADRYAHLDFS